MERDDTAFDELLDHARSSQWRGELPGATHRVRQRNPTCGDEVALAVRFQEGIIQDVRFQGKGCFVSQASASLLCEHVEGRPLAELQQQSCSDLLGFDPARLATGRQGCVRLAYTAWQKLLARIVDEPRVSGSVSGVKED